MRKSDARCPDSERDANDTPGQFLYVTMVRYSDVISTLSNKGYLIFVNLYYTLAICGVALSPSLTANLTALILSCTLCIVFTPLFYPLL